MVCTKGLKVMSRPTSALVPSTRSFKTLAVKIGRTIFGLHEPAGSVDSEEVQVVLDAAADEPALGIEAVSVQARRGAGVGAQQGAARPVGPGVTAVDVGQNVRSDQIAKTSTGGPSCVHLGGADEPTANARIPDVALQAAERTVAEDTEHPRRAALPIIAGTHGAEPAISARPGVGADDAGAVAVLSTPPLADQMTAAAAAENVEASPAGAVATGAGALV